jgi:hypothetical protein
MQKQDVHANVEPKPKDEKHECPDKLKSRWAHQTYSPLFACRKALDGKVEFKF